MSADFFTPEQLALLTAGRVYVSILVKFDFASGAEYAWNGNTKLTVNGNTYLPMHGTAQIEGLGLSGSGASDSVTVTVDGLPDQALGFLAKALEDTPLIDQQLMTVYLQLFDSEWQTVGNPIPIFWGFMQPPKVGRTEMQDDQGAIQSIAIVAENAFFNRSRPPYGRYTDRDQQARSPGDKFFGFVSSILMKTVTYPDY
ncbi:hypothetical protein FJW07_14145 [Mesorhizobium sp. B3-1-9]|uniref:hypothetical protein n=1 Tax=Mesorhizobium sp. B3-1-9 TaxID=2589892 RepID=UPI00112AA2BA|nr:hypothetical protein [Mesorhizobium sp. B3-1-9]TPI39315.1 hypothetical protein FJW07_14145 [Mesorhizobium sp. B3-1-9]